MSKSTEQHLDYCNTDNQTEIIKMRISGMSNVEIGAELGRDPKRISEIVQKVHRRAAASGIAPDQNLNREVAPGFTTKRVRRHTILKARSFYSGTFRSQSARRLRSWLINLSRDLKMKSPESTLPLNRRQALMTISWLLILLGITILACSLITLRQWVMTTMSRLVRIF